jgi:hypothetical protein
MDRDQFDTVVKLVWTTASRRAALGTVLGAALLGRVPALHAAKRKNKKKRKKKDRDCYPGRSCQPGPGQDNAGCDFEGSVAFFEGNFQGSSFHGANLAGAQMAQANLQGVDLGGACLVGANLLDADLAGANLDGAIFCHTTMPDGTTNDSGCGQGTRCCPTGCQGELCPTECIHDINRVCSIFGTPCCPGLVCTPTFPTTFITSCQWPCGSNKQCTDRLGEGWKCDLNIAACLYLGKPCCTKIIEDE